MAFFSRMVARPWAWCLWWALLPVLAQASTSGVVISQVYGGGGNSGATYKNDFIEVLNSSGSAVSVSGWSVQYASSTGTAWQVTNLPNVTLQPGQYLLVQEAAGAGGTQSLPTPDATGSIAMSSTTGKVALVKSTTALSGATPAATAYEDLVGFGSASGFEGSAAAPAISNTTAALRNGSGCTDSNNNNLDFTAGAPNPRNTASPLNTTCGGVVSNQPIVPVCPATLNVALGRDVPILLTASDADHVVNAATLTSAPSGFSLGTVSAASGNGQAASVFLTVASSVAAGTYNATVQFANNGAQTASCTSAITVKASSTSPTPIYTIQGSGATSPLNGSSVTTNGVVTKINNNGFYLQDAVGDGNAATSDGVFVFTSTAPRVNVGDAVELTGLVSEFNTGAATNATTLANLLTELKTISNQILLGRSTVLPTVITLPLADGDDMEHYEGMLVTINNPLTASQNYFQGRYGQVTLSANGRLFKPTNQYRPGTTQANALVTQNQRSSILLDDGSSLQDPNPIPYIGLDNTLRAGDTISSLTGVVDYGLATSTTTGIASYKVHPTQAVNFTRVNARTAAPATVGGNIKVASANVLNFFTTFSDGKTVDGQTGQGCSLGGAVAASNCRGADNLAEFNRQRSKIIAELVALNADVVGLMELQNNGNTAAQNLVDGLNASFGAGTYAVIGLPTGGGTGTDAIRVGMIYKPAKVTPVGNAFSDADAIHNRPPLAQGFMLPNGEKFSVIVNHFKSKGSCPSSASDPDADQGDGQGCWNSRRVAQATRLLAFIETVKTTVGDSDVLVIGDLNAYAQEDPINTLTQGGLVNQISRFVAQPYSYVFDGEAGYLDHALATPTLSAQIVGTTEWHNNADEPSSIDYNTEFKSQDFYTPSAYRASDHDPVIVGLNLVVAVAQSITFNALGTKNQNDPDFTLVATASSGLPVTFSSQTPSVCTVNVNAVTLVSSGLCTIAANQAGNASYLAATQVTQSFTVKAYQAITFDTVPSLSVGGSPWMLSATASSGLAVSVVSLTPAICSVSNQQVTALAAGTCTLQASQAGDAVWSSALSVSQSAEVLPVSNGGGSAGSQDSDAPISDAWLLVAGLGLLGVALRARR